MRLPHRFVFGLALGASCLAAAATGCTLLTSLDGFTSNDDDPSPDGGDEVATDPRRSDAMAVGDAVASKTDSGDAGYNGFCESVNPAPSFCSDFENEMGAATLPAAWGSITKYGAGSLFIDSKASKSPPASLFVNFDQGTLQGEAALVKVFDAPIKSTLQIDLDTRVESHDGQQVVLLDVELVAGSGKHAHELFRFQDGNGAEVLETADQVGDGGTLYASTGNVPMNAGNWVHVRMTLKQTMTSSTMTLDIDGMNGAGTNFRANRYASVPPKVTMGIVYLPNATTGWHVRYDNIVINTN